MAANKITLAHKKNLRDFEPKRVEYLNKIKDLTGIEFEFAAEPSLEAYLSDVIDNSSEHHVCGQALYGDDGYLHHVLKFFEKQWVDELVRDAIKDATKNKKIVIRNNRVENEIAFENGTMYLNIPAYNFNLYKKYVSDFDPSRIL